MANANIHMWDDLRKIDLKLLEELPMLRSISNLAEYGYESVNESLELILIPQ